MIIRDGRSYGTAAQIARALGSDVTEDMVRRWADRGLIPRYGHLFCLDEAAIAERDTRLSRRGRPRKPLDSTPAAA